jgi:hypothetical protein
MSVIQVTALVRNLLVESGAFPDYQDVESLVDRLNTELEAESVEEITTDRTVRFSRQDFDHDLAKMRKFDEACSSRLDVWLPANRGTETEFTARNGKRLLYCYNPAKREHAYFDQDEDQQLSNEEAMAFLFD